jgi:hypothetical protein
MSDDMSDVFNSETAAPAAASSLEKVVTLAEEAKALEDHIASINELLKAAQGRFNEIRLTELPTLMAEIGIKDFATAPDEEGKYTEIKVGDFVGGSLPKEPDKRAAAIAYLEQDEDRASLVKTQLAMEFGKGEHNMALSLAEELREKGFTVNLESGVHAGTLQAFAREALRNGDEIDCEKLGLFHGTKADIKIKKAKVKKAKK